MDAAFFVLALLLAFSAPRISASRFEVGEHQDTGLSRGPSVPNFAAAAAEHVGRDNGLARKLLDDGRSYYRFGPYRDDWDDDDDRFLDEIYGYDDDDDYWGGTFIRYFSRRDDDDDDGWYFRNFRLRGNDDDRRRRRMLLTHQSQKASVPGPPSERAYYSPFEELRLLQSTQLFLPEADNLAIMGVRGRALLSDDDDDDGRYWVDDDDDDGDDDDDDDDDDD